MWNWWGLFLYSSEVSAVSHSQEEVWGPAACVTCPRAKFELLSCTVVVWTRALWVLPCGHTVDAAWITRRQWPVMGTGLHLELEDLG